MSWQEVPRQKTRGPVHGVTVAMHRNGILNVLIGQPVADMLGWSVGCRIVTYIGNGPHEGKMRLDRDETGRKLSGKEKSAGPILYISESLLPRHWYRGHIPSLMCQYEVDDGGLVISLPRALWKPMTRQLYTVSTGG